jgi:hypothetical protein
MGQFTSENQPRRADKKAHLGEDRKRNGQWKKTSRMSTGGRAPRRSKKPKPAVAYLAAFRATRFILLCGLRAPFAALSKDVVGLIAKEVFDSRFEVLWRGVDTGVDGLLKKEQTILERLELVNDKLLQKRPNAKTKRMLLEEKDDVEEELEEVRAKILGEKNKKIKL